MSSNNLFLGISLDNDIIRFIEFEKAATKTVITNMGEKLLPENSCVSQYNIFNESVIKQHLKEMLKEYKIRAENVIYFVPDERVLKRKIKLPESSTDNEIYTRIKQRAKQILEQSINDVYFDFTTQVNKEDKKLDVTVSAVRKETINETDALLRESGLKPCVADVPSTSLARINEYVRTKFSKKKKIKLSEDDVLIYIIKESNQCKVMFYNYYDNIYAFQHNAHNDSDMGEVVKEAYYVVQQNNIEHNFAGFIIINIDENNLKVEQLEWPSMVFDLNKEFKTKVKNPPVLSQQWLELIGMALRKTNHY